jgi:hypothetical protein
MIFLTPVITWLGTWVGRAAVGGGLVATFFGWLLLHDHRIRVEEKNVTIAHIEEASNVAAEKATKARRSVDAIPDGRLRDKYFRD